LASDNNYYKEKRMNPTLTTTMIAKLSYKQFSTDMETNLDIYNEDRQAFIDRISTLIFPKELESTFGVNTTSLVSVEIKVLTIYFDPQNEHHNKECQTWECNLHNLDVALSEIYIHLKEHKEKMHLEHMRQLQEALEDSEEDILVYLEESEPETPRSSRIYSEAHMLGAIGERIANANADELEEAKEQASPEAQFAHPTHRTHTGDFVSYTSEMTVEDDPAPAKNTIAKIWEVSGVITAICAGLSAIFLTVALGAMALHQVKTLF